METERLNELKDFESQSENIYDLLYFNWLLDSINEIIFWKRPVVTGSILAIVVSLFLIINFFSLIYFIVSIGFVLITLSFILRLYSSIRRIKNPLKQYVEDVFEFISIQITDKRSTLNKSVKNFSDIFLFNNYMSSLKFFFFSFAIFYIGKYCDFNTVLETIAFLSVVPQSLCLLKSSIYKGTKEEEEKPFEIPKTKLKDNGEDQISNCETNTIQNDQRTTNYLFNPNFKTINILLLGETGVGKSTWINGFVNYLTYDSLEEAERGAPVSVIPAKFTVTDSNFNEHIITYGSNSNKNESADRIGQSSTQMPQTYVFDSPDMKIKIIDTPGIGDTRGIEKDKENMQNIMAHISHYKQFNGIIILLKPNNSRLNVMFSFCIKELLTHLHKDACKNIIICFTNARSTFYRPGDTMPALKELLKSFKDIQIKLEHDNVFCMDNESVRFLMALKKIKFDEKERNEYAISWKKSVDESMRLICKISYLDPHLTQKTLSINEARRSIIEQSRPMALIAKAIQTNIDKIEDKKEEAIAVDSSKEELLKKLQVPSVRLKIIDLDHPRTVCTDPPCIDKISVGEDGVQRTHYKTICHSHCHITTDKNVIRCAALQNCDAMDKSTGKCQVCKCSWETHMHITYDTIQENVMIEDKGIRRLIDSKNGIIKAIAKHKNILDETIKQLRYEKQEMAKVNAIFACFLKHNAIATYNDSLMDYLDHLIKEEERKTKDEANSKTLEGLKSLKADYVEQIKIIEKATKNKNENNITNTVENLDVKKINELMLKLLELPNIGGMLKDAMEKIRKENKKATKLNEKVIKCHSKGLLQNILSKAECVGTVVKKFFKFDISTQK